MSEEGRDDEKDRRCLVCKYCGDKKYKNLSSSSFYGREGRGVRVYLCHKHEIELFILGQVRFLRKYYPVFLNSISNDDNSFFKVADQILSKNGFY